MKILSCNYQPHAQTRQSLRAWGFFYYENFLITSKISLA